MKISFACTEKRRSHLVGCEGFILSEEEKVKYLNKKTQFTLLKRLRVSIENDENIQIFVRPFFKFPETGPSYKIYYNGVTKRINQKEITSGLIILPNRTFEFNIQIVKDKRGVNKEENEFCIEANAIGTDPKVVFSAKTIEVNHKYSSQNKNTREDRHGRLNSYYTNPNKEASVFKISMDPLKQLLSDNSTPLNEEEIKIYEKVALDALNELNISETKESEANLHKTQNLPEVEKVENTIFDFQKYDVATNLIWRNNFVTPQHTFPPVTQFVTNRNSSFVPSFHAQNPYPLSRTLAASSRNLSYNQLESRTNLIKKDHDKIERLKKNRNGVIQMHINGVVSSDHTKETLRKIDKQINEIYSNPRK